MLEIKRLTVNLILSCLLIQIVATKVAGQKWFKRNDKWYYIEDNYKYTWYEALLQCSLRDMSLLTLQTPEEHDDLAVMLNAKNFLFNPPHIWIGAIGANKQFAWIANGQQVFTDKWVPNNPDNNNNEENCLHISENTIGLNDRKCDFKIGFICERNL